MKIQRIIDLKSNKINLPASKSISNRLLILNSLSNTQTVISNLSRANDTALLLNILNQLKSDKKSYSFNIKNAGTTLRFLTGFLSQKRGIFILRCSERMKKRPIGELVETLKTLGAKIEYLEKKGFPPLRITGAKLKSNKISISGKTSSQFISALLLIAPTLPDGLSITISDKISSLPYIKMTLDLLSKFGIIYNFDHNFINIKHQEFQPPKNFSVESDWSAASYWYGFASLLNKEKIVLSNLLEKSIQGDSRLIEIYSKLNIKTSFENNNVILTKNSRILPKYIELDLQNEPDLAPSIAVNLCLLNIKFKLIGLKNLHIKECDRISAIIKNLENFGFSVKETSLGILEWNGEYKQSLFDGIINTHNDHRIAMAFSLFATKQNISINNPECVEKSYPSYWENF